MMPRCVVPGFTYRCAALLALLLSLCTAQATAQTLADFDGNFSDYWAHRGLTIKGILPPDQIEPPTVCKPCQDLVNTYYEQKAALAELRSKRDAQSAQRNAAYQEAKSLRERIDIGKELVREGVTNQRIPAGMRNRLAELERQIESLKGEIDSLNRQISDLAPAVRALYRNVLKCLANCGQLPDVDPETFDYLEWPSLAQIPFVSPPCPECADVAKSINDWIAEQHRTAAYYHLEVDRKQHIQQQLDFIAGLRERLKELERCARKRCPVTEEDKPANAIPVQATWGCKKEKLPELAKPLQHDCKHGTCNLLFGETRIFWRAANKAVEQYNARVPHHNALCRKAAECAADPQCGRSQFNEWVGQVNAEALKLASLLAKHSSAVSRFEEAYGRYNACKEKYCPPQSAPDPEPDPVPEPAPSPVQDSGGSGIQEIIPLPGSEPSNDPQTSSTGDIWAGYRHERDTLLPAQNFALPRACEPCQDLIDTYYEQKALYNAMLADRAGEDTPRYTSKDVANQERLVQNLRANSLRCLAGCKLLRQPTDEQLFLLPWPLTPDVLPFVSTDCNDCRDEAAAINRWITDNYSAVNADASKRAWFAEQVRKKREALENDCIKYHCPPPQLPRGSGVLKSPLDAWCEKMKKEVFQNSLEEWKKLDEEPCDTIEIAPPPPPKKQNYFGDGNWSFQIDPEDADDTDRAVLAPSITSLPNDPSVASSDGIEAGLADQWGLSAIGLLSNPDGWLASGEAITVAVIDSGLDVEHPEIREQLWHNPDEIAGNNIDDDGNGFVDDVHGWNFLSNNADLTDYNGHGTLVAGIIAAQTNNRRGIAGVNPNARIMALKVADPLGNGSSYPLASAIVYAVEMGARVINISMGGDQFAQEEQAAAEFARRQGVVVIVAAGNTSESADAFWPAALDATLTVAAATPDLKRSEFSNWGAAIDITAPGSRILSLRARFADPMRRIDPNYSPGDNVAGARSDLYFASGTSFAAPFVSGAASLLWSADPNLTAEDITRVLLQSAKDIEAPGIDTLSGYGLLDAASALEADPAFYIDALITGAAPVQDASGVSVAFQGTADADALETVQFWLAPASESPQWHAVGDELNAGVIDDTLVTVPVSALQGAPSWVLRMQVTHRNGKQREARFPLVLQ